MPFWIPLPIPGDAHQTPPGTIAALRRQPASPGRPLSIGIILHDFSLGGTERIALRLAARWSQDGACVTLFCGSTTGVLKPLVSPAITLVAAPSPISRGAGSRQRLGQAAAHHFAAHPVDVCFVPGNFHWPVVPAIARLPSSVRPRIVAQVSASLDKPQRGKLRQWLFHFRMRQLLRHADSLVGLSDHATRLANIIMGKTLTRTIALPALDDHAAPPILPPQDGRMIVAAGRLVPEKGFDTLIDAVASLPFDDVDLVILGAGPDEQRLRQHAIDRRIADRVHFQGYVPDIRPWLDKARLCVLSSLYEGFPAVIIEALAAGRPLVVTDCTPAAWELPISDHGGHVVPVGDPKAMAAALIGILTAPPPAADRLAMLVARFRIGAVAAQYISLFGTLAQAQQAEISLPPRSFPRMPQWPLVDFHQEWQR